MPKEQVIVEMEDGTYKKNLKDSHAVELIDAFGKHSRFVKGVVGLVGDAVGSDDLGVRYPLEPVLDEAEKRLDMLKAIADELSYRAGVKRDEEIKGMQQPSKGKGKTDG